jgi:hypothetical protein
MIATKKAAKGGASYTGIDRPTHVRGINQGNATGSYESMAGHHSDGSSTAARSTGIRIKAHEPIDPSMPNLSPG